MKSVSHLLIYTSEKGDDIFLMAVVIRSVRALCMSNWKYIKLLGLAEHAVVFTSVQIRTA